MSVCVTSAFVSKTDSQTQPVREHAIECESETASTCAQTERGKEWEKTDKKKHILSEPVTVVAGGGGA